MDEMTMNLAGAAAVQPSVGEAKTPSAKASAAAAQSTGEKVLPSEYYYSPKGKIDPSSGVYVIEVRDSETGEVVSQYPRKQGAEGYRRAAAAAPQPARPEPAPAAPPSDSTPAAGVSAAPSD